MSQPPTWYDDALSASLAAKEEEESPWESDLQHGLFAEVSASNAAYVGDALASDTVLHTGYDTQRMLLVSGLNKETSAIAVSDARIEMSRPVTFSNDVNMLARLQDPVNDDLRVLGTRVTGSNLSSAGIFLRAGPVPAHEQRLSLVAPQTAPLSQAGHAVSSVRVEPQARPGEVRGEHYVRVVAGAAAGQTADESNASYVEVFGLNPLDPNSPDMTRGLVDRAISMGTSGQERLRITGGGWAGLGTSNPTALLTVQGGDLHVQGHAESHSGPVDATSNGVMRVVVRHSRSRGGVSLGQSNDGSASLSNADGPLDVSFCNEMTFCNARRGFLGAWSPDGYLGVAVRDPQTAVDVDGDVRARATVIGQTAVMGNPSLATASNHNLTLPSYAGFWHCNEGPTRPIILHDTVTGVTQLGCTRGGGIAFSDENAPMAAIVDGYMGINTLTPVARLDVRGGLVVQGPRASIGPSLSGSLEQGLDVQGAVRATRALFLGEEAPAQQGDARAVLRLSHLDFEEDLGALAPDAYAYVTVALLRKDDSAQFGTVRICGDLGAKAVDEPKLHTGFLSASVTLGAGAAGEVTATAQSSWIGGSPAAVAQYTDLQLFRAAPGQRDYNCVLLLRARRSSVFTLDVRCSALGIVPLHANVSLAGPPPGAVRSASLLLDAGVRTETVTWEGRRVVGPLQSDAEAALQLAPGARLGIAHEQRGSANPIVLGNCEARFVSANLNGLSGPLAFAITGPAPGTRPYLSIADTAGTSNMGDTPLQTGIVLRSSGPGGTARVGIGTDTPSQTFDVKGISRAGHLLMVGDAADGGWGVPDAAAADRGGYIGFNLRGNDGSTMFVNNPGAGIGMDRGFVFVDQSTACNCMRIGPAGDVTAAGSGTFSGGQVTARSPGLAASTADARLVLSNADGAWTLAATPSSATTTTIRRQLSVFFSCNATALPPVLRATPAGRVALNLPASSTPQETLYVRAAADADEAVLLLTNRDMGKSLRVSQTTSQDAQLDARGAQDLVLAVDGLAGLRLRRSSGFVGLRNATPKAPLAFAANEEAVCKISLAESALRQDASDCRFDGFGFSGGSLLYNTRAAGGDHVFTSARGDRARAELLRIAGSGAGVCVSSQGQTSAPLATLDVRGGAFVAGALAVGFCNAALDMTSSAVPMTGATAAVHAPAPPSVVQGAEPALLLFSTCNDDSATCSLRIDTQASNARPYVQFRAGAGTNGAWSAGVCNATFVVAPTADPCEAFADPARGPPLCIDRVTGFVGMGVAAPGAQLHVAGELRVDGLATAGSAAMGRAAVGEQEQDTAVFGHAQVGPLMAALQQLQDGSTTTFCACNLVRFARDATESNVIVVDMTHGRVGVQTDTPSVELDVEGSCRIANILTVNSNLVLSGDLFVRGKIVSGDAMGGEEGSALNLTGNEFTVGGLRNSYLNTEALTVRMGDLYADASVSLQAASATAACNLTLGLASLLGAQTLVQPRDAWLSFRGPGLALAPANAPDAGLRMDDEGQVVLASTCVTVARPTGGAAGICIGSHADAFSIYTAAAGDSAFTGRPAIPGPFTSNALRLRIGSNTVHHGLIVESSDNFLAASVRPQGTAYFAGSLGVARADPRDRVHVHDGNVRLSGARDAALRFETFGTNDEESATFMDLALLDSAQRRLVFRSGRPDSWRTLLAIDDTTGALGVGTESPAAALHVRASSTALLLLEGPAGGAVTATSAGALHVGSSPSAGPLPPGRLTVRCTTPADAAGGHLRLVGPAPGPPGPGPTESSGVYLAFATDGAPREEDAARLGVRPVASAGVASAGLALSLQCGGQERVSVSPQGRVGIGLSSEDPPLARLHVHGGDLLVSTSATERGQRVLFNQDAATTAFAGVQSMVDGLSYCLADAGTESHVFSAFERPAAAGQPAQRKTLMRLSGRGFLALGSNAPAAAVHVQAGDVLLDALTAYSNVRVHRTDLVSQPAGHWNHLTLSVAELDPSSSGSSAALFARLLEDPGRTRLLALSDGSLAACSYDANTDYYNAVAQTHRSLQVRRFFPPWTGPAGRAADAEDSVNNILQTSSVAADILVPSVSLVNAVRAPALCLESLSGPGPTWSFAPSRGTLAVGCTDPTSSLGSSTPLALDPAGRVLVSPAGGPALGALDIDDPRYARPSVPAAGAQRPALFATLCNAGAAENDSGDVVIADFRAQDLQRGVGISLDSVLATGTRADQRLRLAARGACNVEVENGLAVSRHEAQDRPTASLANLATGSAARASLALRVAAGGAASLSLSSSTKELLLANDTAAGSIRLATSAGPALVLQQAGGSNRAAFGLAAPPAHAVLAVAQSLAVTSPDVQSTPARVYLGADAAHGLSLAWQAALARPALVLAADVTAQTDVVLGHGAGPLLQSALAVRGSGDVMIGCNVDTSVAAAASLHVMQDVFVQPQPRAPSQTQSAREGSRPMGLHLSFTSNADTQRALIASRNAAEGVNCELVVQGKDVLLQAAPLVGAEGAGELTLKLTETGDVGVGTLQPLAKLDVRGALRVGGTFVASNEVGALTIAGGSPGIPGATADTVISTSAAGVTLTRSKDPALAFLRFDAATGFVGFNAAAPAYRAHIGGSAFASNLTVASERARLAAPLTAGMGTLALAAAAGAPAATGLEGLSVAECIVLAASNVSATAITGGPVVGLAAPNPNNATVTWLTRLSRVDDALAGTRVEILAGLPGATAASILASGSNVRLTTSNVDIDSNVTVRGRLLMASGAALSVAPDAQLALNADGAYNGLSAKGRVLIVPKSATSTATNISLDSSGSSIDIVASSSASGRVCLLSESTGESLDGGAQRGDVSLSALAGGAQAVCLATQTGLLTLRGRRLGLGIASPAERVHIVDGSVMVSTRDALAGARLLLGSNSAGVLRFDAPLRSLTDAELLGVHAMLGSNDGFFAGIAQSLTLAPALTPVIAWGDATDLVFHANPSRASDSRLREVARISARGALGLGTSNNAFEAGEQLACAGSVFIGSPLLRGHSAIKDDGARSNTRLTFDCSRDAAAGGTVANKIRLTDLPGWVAGFGVTEAQLSHHSGGDHAFYAASTRADFGLEVLRLKATGEVGIGAPEAAARLHVRGDVRIESGSNVALGSTVGMTFASAGAAAGRFCVRADGRVGVSEAAPAAQLQIGVPGGQTDPRSNGLAVVNSNAAAAAHAVVSLRTAAAATGGDAFLSLEAMGQQTGWSVGLHRGDGGKFKIASASNSLRDRTALTLTQEGRLGLAAASNPAEALHVDAGSVLASGGSFIAMAAPVATGAAATATAAARAFFAVSNATAGLVGMGTGLASAADLRLFAPAAASKAIIEIAAVSEADFSSAGLAVRGSVTASNGLTVLRDASVAGRVTVAGGLTLGASSTPATWAFASATGGAAQQLRLDACGSNGAYADAALTLTSDGALGIGKVQPAERLDVDGNVLLGSASGGALLFRGTAGGDDSTRFNTFIAENKYTSLSGATELVLAKFKDASAPNGPDRIRAIAAQHVFQVYGANQAAPTSVGNALDRAFTTVMTVNSNACVGVNNDRPVYALDVVGNINLTGSLLVNGAALQLQNLTSWVYTASTSTLIAPTGASVGIGLMNPTALLHVRGSLELENVLTSAGDGTAVVLTNHAQTGCNLAVRGALAVGSGATVLQRGANALCVTAGHALLQAVHDSGGAPGQWLEFRSSNAGAATATRSFALAAALGAQTAAGNRLLVTYSDPSEDPSDATALLALRGDGSLGLGTASPGARLHVLGSSLLLGRVVVNDNTDGPARGIQFLSSNDTTWGMYLASSGAAKSFSGGFATQGSNFAGLSLRVRAPSAVNQGIVFENSSEQLLASIESATGNTYVRGTLRCAGAFETAGAITGNGALNIGANAVTCGAVTATGSLRLLDRGSVAATLTLEGAAARLGVGTASPTDPLHVAGSSVLLGRVRISDGNDTSGLARGLALWSDNSYGLYTAGAGAARSFSGGVSSASAAAGVSSTAMRFRCSNATTHGFIFENSTEGVLLAVNGNTGAAVLQGELRAGQRGSFNSPATADSLAALNVRPRTNTSPAENGLYVFNPANTAGNHATACVRVGGAAAGNAFYSLDVVNSTTGASAAGWAIGIDNADQRKLKIRSDWNFASGTDRVTFTAAGNVGIGTASPTCRLHVSTDATLLPVGIMIDESSSASSRRACLALGTQWQVVQDTAASGTADFGIQSAAGETFLAVNAAGSVGIGTSAPEARLHVQGDVLVSSGNLQLGGKSRLVTNDGTANARNGVMLQSSNDTTWGMYLAPSTGGSYSFSGAGAAVAGGTAGMGATAMRFRCPLNDVNGFIFEGASGATDTLLASINGSTGNLWVKGDVTVFSDARYKADLRRIEGALDRILSLTGYTYHMIDDLPESQESHEESHAESQLSQTENHETPTETETENHTNPTKITTARRHVGLLAQDVEAVLPEAVHESAATPGEERGRLSIAYGNLAAMFVEAIKELHEDVADVRRALGLGPRAAAQSCQQILT